MEPPKDNSLYDMILRKMEIVADIDIFSIRLYASSNRIGRKRVREKWIKLVF